MAYSVLHTLSEEQKTETEKRKQSISTIYERLNKELERRDLSDLPTDKLIQLIATLAKQIDNKNVLINERRFQTGL